MEKALYSCEAFRDLKNAFETLNHNILLSKIGYYRIGGVGATSQDDKINCISKPP